MVPVWSVQLPGAVLRRRCSEKNRPLRMAAGKIRRKDDQVEVKGRRGRVLGLPGGPLRSTTANQHVFSNMFEERASSSDKTFYNSFQSFAYVC